MKTWKFLITYPILIGIGWFCTKLSEHYFETLPVLDVDFDFE